LRFSDFIDKSASVCFSKGASDGCAGQFLSEQRGDDEMTDIRVWLALLALAAAALNFGSKLVDLMREKRAKRRKR
jgi:hypothetical protein